MKKQLVMCIVTMLVFVWLSGCTDNSNMNNGNTNDNNTSNIIEEMIIGAWEREDNRTFTYEGNGTLAIEGAANVYQYWFEEGYLFDSSDSVLEPWIYKYNINFEDEDKMVLEYLGYYLDDEWNDDATQTYVFHRKKS